MNDETINRIITILEETGREVAHEGFRIALEYTIASSIVWLVFGALLFLASLGAAIWIIRKQPERDSRGYMTGWDSEMKTLALILPSIVGILSLWLALHNLVVLLAPEWATISRLLSLL